MHDDPSEILETPLNSFFRPSDQALSLARLASSLGLVTLIIRQYSIDLTKIPWLEIELPQGQQIPIATIVAIGSIFSCILYYIYYFEELFEFNQVDFRLARDGAKQLSGIQPPAGLPYHLVLVVKGADKGEMKSKGWRRRFGILRHTILLVFPATIIFLVLKQEVWNIFYLFW